MRKQLKLWNSNTSLIKKNFNKVLHCSEDETKLNKKFWEELIAYFPLIHDPNRKRHIQQFIYCCVFVAAVTCLPRRCLATTGGIHRHKDWCEEFMKCATENGSDAMIHTSSFINTGSVIQKDNIKIDLRYAISFGFILLTTGPCECGNEVFDSNQGQKFHVWLRNYQLLM
jgi:hypothetical protein